MAPEIVHEFVRDDLTLRDHTNLMRNQITKNIFDKRVVRAAEKDRIDSRILLQQVFYVTSAEVLTASSSPLSMIGTSSGQACWCTWTFASIFRISCGYASEFTVASVARMPITFDRLSDETSSAVGITIPRTRFSG